VAPPPGSKGPISIYSVCGAGGRRRRVSPRFIVVVRSVDGLYYYINKLQQDIFRIHSLFSWGQSRPKCPATGHVARVACGVVACRVRCVAHGVWRVLPHLSTAVTSRLHPPSAAARSRGSAWGSGTGRQPWAASVASGPGPSPRRGLHGQRRWNRRLWRRLARAAEAVAGRPMGRPLPASAELPGAARRALRRQKEPSWGAANGAL